MISTHLRTFAVGALMTATFVAAPAAADERLDQIENAHQAADRAALTELASWATLSRPRRT